MPGPKRSGRSSGSANGGTSGGRRPTKRATSRSKSSKKQHQQHQQQPGAAAAVEQQPEIPLGAPTTRPTEEVQQQGAGGNNGMEMAEANALLQNIIAASGGGDNLMDVAAAAGGANANANANSNDNSAPTTNAGGGGRGMSKHPFDDGLDGGDAASNNKRPKRVSEGSDATCTAAALTDPASNVTSTNGNANDPAGDNFVGGDDFHGGTENGTTTDANNNHNSGEDVDEDPDWNAIMKHEPARSDVPVFLHSRDKFDAAKEKFSNSLENYNASLDECTKGLINVPIDVYTHEDEKVRIMEENLKQGFIRNAEKRESIEENLRKSAEAAQGLFANLMMRMSSTVTRDGAAAGGGGGHGN